MKLQEQIGNILDIYQKELKQTNVAKLNSVSTNAWKHRIQIPIHPTLGHKQYTYITTSRPRVPVRLFQNNPNVLKSNVIQARQLKSIPSMYLKSKSLNAMLIEQIKENARQISQIKRLSNSSPQYREEVPKNIIINKFHSNNPKHSAQNKLFYSNPEPVQRKLHKNLYSYYPTKDREKFGLSSIISDYQNSKLPLKPIHKLSYPLISNNVLNMNQNVNPLLTSMMTKNLKEKLPLKQKQASNEIGIKNISLPSYIKDILQNRKHRALLPRLLQFSPQNTAHQKKVFHQKLQNQQTLRY